MVLGDSWNDLLPNWLARDYGARQSRGDKCVFTLLSEGVVCLIITVYVDGIIVKAHRRECSIAMTVSQFRWQSDLSCYLGMEMTRDRAKGMLHIHQWKYITDMLTELNLDTANPTHTT
jgi:hypothetical protein